MTARSADTRTSTGDVWVKLGGTYNSHNNRSGGYNRKKILARSLVRFQKSIDQSWLINHS